MRQLDQRVSARCSLEPLSRDGVAGYISHRLRVAGGADDRVRFSSDAIDALFRISSGVPRVVNLICDRALHRGHLARITEIDVSTVTQAIDDLGVGTLTAAPSFVTAPVAATAAPSVSPAITAIADPGVAPTLPASAGLSVTPAITATAAAGITAATPPAAAASRVPVSARSMGVPVPLKHSSASTDLSGLEVHDI